MAEEAGKRFVVQTGKGRGAYEVRYALDTLGEAEFWYAGLNTHSGYKKRLVDTVARKVLRRYIS